MILEEAASVKREQKEKKILKKVELRKRVVVSLGVTHTLTGKYEARSRFLYHGTFDTNDAAKLVIVQWNNYLDKHKQEYDSQRKKRFVYLKTRNVRKRG